MNGIPINLVILSTQWQLLGNKMTKGAIWNVAGGSIITANLAVIGWLAISVIDLQRENAAKRAETDLRGEVTDVLNDVDKRLAVIEAIMIFSGKENTTTKEIIPDPLGPLGPPEIPIPVPYGLPDGSSAGEKEEEEGGPFTPSSQSMSPRQFSPRYNLRNEVQQSDR